MFAGFITSYTTTTPKNANDVVYTTITAVDATRLAQNAQISTVTGATAGDLSGTRINQILNTIGWPSSARDVDAWTNYVAERSRHSSYSPSSPADSHK
jgi:predicted phage tail protein